MELGDARRDLQMSGTGGRGGVQAEIKLLNFQLKSPFGGIIPAWQTRDTRSENHNIQVV